MAERGGATLHVLRLASVFEPSRGALSPGSARFDPVGGMQTHTAALSRCLDRRGVAQTVVTARLAGPRCHEQLGLHSCIIRVGVRFPRLRQLWALSALPHVLRPARRIDVVHVHQGEDLAALPLGWLAATVHRCPLVVTLHLSVRHTMRGRSARAMLLRTVGGLIERAVLRRADVVLVLTRRSAVLVQRDGVLPERIHVLPSGFDPELFAGDFDDPFPEVGRPRVAYVGRLAPQKAPGLVVEAFARLTRPAHLLVVGDGPDRRLVESLARSLRVADRMSLRGFVEHAQIPAVLAFVDVLVLPSTYEELGSVLVEAMASGVPVVATRVGGIPEVVDDGVTGFLVPPGDAAAIAATVDRLLGDPVLAKRMAEHAKKRAVSYSWPALAGRVADIYRSIRPRAAADT